MLLRTARAKAQGQVWPMLKLLSSLAPNHIAATLPCGRNRKSLERRQSWLSRNSKQIHVGPR